MKKKKKTVNPMFAEWHAIEDSEEAAAAALKVAGSLARDQQWREARYLRRLSDYEATTIGSLDMARQGKASEQDFLRGDWMPFARRIINAACSQVASKPRPKCVVLTKGVDYAERMQAKQITRFLEGQFNAPQLGFDTLYDLGLAVFRSACVSDGGVAVVEPDVAGERVAISRVHAHDVFFDDLDAEMGSPQQLVMRRRYKRGELSDMHPDAAEEISLAQSHIAGKLTGSGKVLAMTPRDAHMVTVWDVWKLKQGTACGRHLRILESRPETPVVLVDEEYEHREFPVVILAYDRSEVGPWGKPLIDTVEVSQRRTNETYIGIDETVRLSGGGYLLYDKNSEVDEAALESNKALKLVSYATGKAPPTVVMPQPFNSATLQWAETQHKLGFELSAVSELAAQGRKEPGIESGVAIRHMNDLQGSVFLTQSRAYEQFYVNIARRIISAVQDLAKQGVTPKSWLPSHGIIEEIDWKDWQPDGDDAYGVQLAPSSSLEDTVAGRFQTISDMQQAGLIPADVAERLLTSADPDLEGQTQRRQAQYNWIERLIYEVHQEEDPDVEIQMEPPDPLMNLGNAIAQVSDAYLEFSSWRGTPENKRRALRNWILQAVDLVSIQNQPAPAPPPGPGALPPGAPLGAPTDMGPPAGMSPAGPQM